MRKLILLSLAVFFLMPGPEGFAQKAKNYKKTMFTDPYVTIDLVIIMAKNPCDSNNTKGNEYQLHMTNVSSNQEYHRKKLSWRMNFMNCNGEMVKRTISVDLSQHHEEGLNRSVDWTFNGSYVDSAFYDVMLGDYHRNDNDEIIQVSSIKPDEIVGNLNIMTGGVARLSIKGGKLSKDAKWVWYKEKCGGTPVNYGVTFDAKPKDSTIYYVRAEGAFKTTECVSVLVAVDDNSIKPSKVIGSTKYCRGDKSPITLEVYGGKLGYKAYWEWFKDNCGGQPFAKGDSSITDFPTQTTTYYVRAKGVTNTTDCIAFTVDVVDASTAPVSILGNSVLCEGETLQLSVNGGNLAADAKWVWYRNGKSSTDRVGEGNMYSATVKYSGTYYVRGEGYCGNTAFQEISTSVKKLSNVSRASISNAKVKRNFYQLTINNATLGDEAKWVWYKKDCDGKKLGEGETIKVKLKKKTELFVRGEGQCNTTDCVHETFISQYDHSKTSKSDRQKGDNNFNLPESKFKFGFISAGILLQDQDIDVSSTENYSYSFAAGSQSVYVSVKYGAKKNTKFESTNTTILPTNTTAGNNYIFNGRVFNRRTSYTAGFMFGVQGLRIYMGAGYGQLNAIWGVDVLQSGSGILLAEEWAKNVDQSITGVEGEAGILLKWGVFNIRGGWNIIYNPSNNKQFIDGQFGVGLSF